MLGYVHLTAGRPVLERRAAALQRQATQQQAQQRQAQVNAYRDAVQAAEDAQRRADALTHAAAALPEDTALSLLEGQIITLATADGRQLDNVVVRVSHLCANRIHLLAGEDCPFRADDTFHIV